MPNVKKLQLFPLKLFFQVLRGCLYVAALIKKSFSISTYLHTTPINIKKYCHQILFSVPESKIKNGINYIKLKAKSKLIPKGKI